jgi:hypothetical protein
MEERNPGGVMRSGIRGVPGRLVAAGLCVLAPLSSAVAQDAKSILGAWRGTSVCVNREAAPACRDEEVVYEFRELTPPVADKLAVKADKIVDGKIVPMGMLEVTWDPKAGAWSCDFQTQRFHGLWSYAPPRGDELAGTLVSLPDRTLLRKAAARRVARG